MAEQEMLKQEEKNASLEEMFSGLEQVITELEGQDVTLEKSFQLYQKGMSLLKQCNTTLDTVEKQVQILDENGETHDF